jgi:hypothetical protein
MGWWGNFDNDNDTVYEEWHDLIKSFIKKKKMTRMYARYRECEGLCTEKESKEYNTFFRKNKLQFIKYTCDHVAKLKKTNFKGWYWTEEHSEHSWVINGIILELFTPKIKLLTTNTRSKLQPQ